MHGGPFFLGGGGGEENDMEHLATEGYVTALFEFVGVLGLTSLGFHVALCRQVDFAWFPWAWRCRPLKPIQTLSRDPPINLAPS